MTQRDQAQDRKVREISLSKLMLDAKNPRFAGALGGNARQKAIVNYVADTIGISDLLSSMSQGGFYRSSPLIGISRDRKTIIVEGNRRLAAALVLTGDQRAVTQKHRVRNYPIKPDAGPSLTTLPVLIARSREEVLPYLGIAHIVGNKKWDSYAKAAWAAKVADKEIYPGGLRQISDEIGDKHRTLERMVQAYRLVTQLEATARFSPEKTIKKGRGTAKYPFSWVYTALGYAAIREWLGISHEDMEEATSQEIITDLEGLNRGGDLLTWMFGSQVKNRQPALSDSRQISDLAAAVTDERVLSHLRRGRNLDDAQDAVQPAHEKLMDGLVLATETLERVLGVLGASTDELSERHLRDLEREARRTRSVANQVYSLLRDRSDDSD
ncbi:MAG: hypothetical protein GY725_19890 [bacterium]|nr:hypothetical protein [bacterium]